MNENEFEYDGKIYVSVEDEKGVCIGCSFDSHDKCLLDDVYGVPTCSGSFREDGMDVIFVEVQDERAKR